ncbi:MAG: GxxExxY protein [Bacteroidia bacterium]|nr:GxxExxY protein [Bacteroidia bacterium]
MDCNTITEKIIGAAINVHRILGPGMLENAYKQCMVYELKEMGLHVQSEVPVPVIYKEIKLECGYRIDLLVEDKVVVELKTVDEFHPTYEAQILTYLMFADKRVGLLINFKTTLLKNGIKRYRL